MAIDFNKTADSEDFKDLLDTKPKMELEPAKKFDPERVKKNFAIFDKQVDQVRSSIDGFEIKSAEDAATFTQTVGAAKKIVKIVKERAAQLVSDPEIKRVLNYVDLVKGVQKNIIAKLTELEKKGKLKIGQYNYQQEIKRREDEKKMRLEADKRQAEIDKQAEAAGVESIVLPPVVTPKKVEPIRTDTATGSTRFKKKGKVVNFAVLPDQYKMVNEKALQAAIDAGLRPAGVEIEEIPIVSIRTN